MLIREEYGANRLGERRQTLESTYCSAEIAECNCPEACERDHGNE